MKSDRTQSNLYRTAENRALPTAAKSFQ